MCQGYYDHEKPHIPDWPGMDSYKGRFIHAQLWDPSIDYSGKRILVIGSGATAATVIPAFAEKAAHVTMLQRSPTYFYCSENKNELADRLREIGIDEPTIHRVVRAQIMHDGGRLSGRALKEPDVVFEELKTLVRKFTGVEDFSFEPHFTPKYRVWQQRLAFCPEGDIFKAAVAGKLTVMTDTLETFTEKGVRTSSGEEIEADIIVAATGFNMLMMGGIPFYVDGKEVDWHETVNYRGMMFTGVPNMVWVMGYFRASWTLRADMVADFVCRLLAHMKAKGASRVEVAIPPLREAARLFVVARHRQRHAGGHEGIGTDHRLGADLPRALGCMQEHRAADQHAHRNREDKHRRQHQRLGHPRADLGDAQGGGRQERLPVRGRQQTVFAREHGSHRPRRGPLRHRDATQPA